jgi:hypothetical protein
MIGHVLSTAIALSLCFATLPAFAQDPDVATIVERSKAALEPRVPSVRTMRILVSGEDGGTREWTAAQARKRLNNSNWMLTVVLAPEDVRGQALLVQEHAEGPDRQWTYLPHVRRVREIVPVSKYQAFLGTDFTLADFGFMTAHRSYKLLGREEVGGKPAYKIEEIPEERWYYWRVVTWVSADNWMPLRREFYAPGDTLWKVEDFGQITTIDGVPTALHLRMDDVRLKARSEIRVSKVSYGVDIPDSLFDPAHLSASVDSKLLHESN